MQRVLEPFCAVQNHVHPRRHLLSADQYRQIRAEGFQQWCEAARRACRVSAAVAQAADGPTSRPLC